MPKIANQNLSGVSETLLIPLYHQALESQRPDAILSCVGSLSAMKGTLPFDRLLSTRGRLAGDREGTFSASLPVLGR